MTQKLYVGNLSYQTTDDSLRALFAQFGQVESARLVIDRDTRRSRGFAFVEMATDQDAEAAIMGLNGKSVDGREIRVDKAKPQADRPPRQDDRRRPRW